MGYDDDMARAGVADAPEEGFALLKPQTGLSSYVRMRFHWICRQVNAGGLRLSVRPPSFAGRLMSLYSQPSDGPVFTKPITIAGLMKLLDMYRLSMNPWPHPWLPGNFLKQ